MNGVRSSMALLVLPALLAATLLFALPLCLLLAGSLRGPTGWTTANFISFLGSAYS